ncbi:MAG: rRNA pseudouridine synthase [Clostridia bacterium]|nr:rRNA pseudouridine synthase [Clostridia bacterium]
MERLQKFLAHAGVASRRSCEELILQGRVKVNGKVITALGTKIDPQKDIVEIDGKRVKKEEKKVYVLLNKPAGYVTTSKDPQGRPTVLDLIKDINERIYPVGRLDYETEGLLLLTNDGELSFRLTHPKYKVEKVYQALVKGIPDESDLEKLRKGIRLEDGITHPAKVKILQKGSNSTLLELIIHEGRNRQVRRMCEAINHPVLSLKRIKIGFLSLGSLPKGKFRPLTPEEVKLLKMRVGLV